MLRYRVLKVIKWLKRVQIAHIEWFGHILYRHPSAPICRCDTMEIEGTKRDKGDIQFHGEKLT